METSGKKQEQISSLCSNEADTLTADLYKVLLEVQFIRQVSTLVPVCLVPASFSSPACHKNFKQSFGMLRNT